MQLDADKTRLVTLSPSKEIPPVYAPLIDALQMQPDYSVVFLHHRSLPMQTMAAKIASPIQFHDVHICPWQQFRKSPFYLEVWRRSRSQSN